MSDSRQIQFLNIAQLCAVTGFSRNTMVAALEKRAIVNSTTIGRARFFHAPTALEAIYRRRSDPQGEET